MFVKNGKYYAFIRNGKMYALVRKIRQYWKTTQTETVQNYYCYQEPVYGIRLYSEQEITTAGVYWGYSHWNTTDSPTSKNDFIEPDPNNTSTTRQSVRHQFTVTGFVDNNVIIEGSDVNYDRASQYDFTENVTITETVPGTANDYTSYTDALKYY